jgi:ketohexokinase
MAKILAIGIATLDIINTVAQYPEENAEIRALSQAKVRGGNATNSLVVLSQLGHQCHWAGILIDEPDSQLIKQDLLDHNIDFSDCRHLPTGKMPTSYIYLNQQTGSRTIVHHRDCPEFDFTDFVKIDLKPFDWIHFEGRNIEQTLLMLTWLKRQFPNITSSLEVEKPRAEIESLFPHADIVLFSKQYVEAQGFSSAQTFLTQIESDQLISCAWGEAGAWAKQADKIYHSSAHQPKQVIDTLGAGDTFNAGFINALINNVSPKQALSDACALAGKKCGQIGLNNLISAK